MWRRAAESTRHLLHTRCVWRFRQFGLGWLCTRTSWAADFAVLIAEMRVGSGGEGSGRYAGGDSERFEGARAGLAGGVTYTFPMSPRSSGNTKVSPSLKRRTTLWTAPSGYFRVPKALGRLEILNPPLLTSNISNENGAPLTV